MQGTTIEPLQIILKHALVVKQLAPSGILPLEKVEWG